VCFAGDGCFMMNGMEINAAVSNHLPIVYVITRNDKLGLVHDLQTFVLGEKTVATKFHPVDAAKVAEGLGARAFRVTRPGELKVALGEALASGETCVIDCFVDPGEVPPLAPFMSATKSFIQRLDFF
jgi:acetolactate synthase I/II/III large subunit